MRYMGDSYVKSEFRLTRTTDNPLHIIGFLSQWKIYLDEIESSLIRPDGRKQGQAVEWRGKKLDTGAFEKLSTEQVGQLYELMHATKDVWKSCVCFGVSSKQYRLTNYMKKKTRTD